MPRPHVPESTRASGPASRGGWAASPPLCAQSERHRPAQVEGEVLGLEGACARWCPQREQPERGSAEHVSHLPHRLLQVGVQPSHATGEEGVHHALWEVATQVCLEEGDHLGLVGLPVKQQHQWLCLCRTGSRAKRLAACQWPTQGLQLGLHGPGVPSGPACSQHGDTLCAGSVAMRAEGRRQPVPTSSPAGPPVPCTLPPAACRGEGSLCLLDSGRTQAAVLHAVWAFLGSRHLSKGSARSEQPSRQH